METKTNTLALLNSVKSTLFECKNTISKLSTTVNELIEIEKSYGNVKKPIEYKQINKTITFTEEEFDDIKRTYEGRYYHLLSKFDRNEDPESRAVLYNELMLTIPLLEKLGANRKVIEKYVAYAK